MKQGANVIDLHRVDALHGVWLLEQRANDGRAVTQIQEKEILQIRKHRDFNGRHSFPTLQE